MKADKEPTQEVVDLYAALFTRLRVVRNEIVALKSERADIEKKMAQIRRDYNIPDPTIGATK